MMILFKLIGFVYVLAFVVKLVTDLTNREVKPENDAYSALVAPVVKVYTNLWVKVRNLVNPEKEVKE